MVVRGTTAAVSPSMTTRKQVFSQITVAILPAWIIPAWIFCRATIPAPRRHPPLHGDGPARLRRQGPAAAGTAQPVAAVHRDGAGQGAQQAPVVADDGHQGSFHAQGDPLTPMAGRYR